MIIYTDGACSGNPGPGGFGIVITWNDDLKDLYQEFCEDTTNNREELKAVIWAMEHYGQPIDGFAQPPIIYSDSAYVVNSLTTWIFNWANNDWKRSKNKPIENLDLIQKYWKLRQAGYEIDLRKCAGHSGIKWNELADKLATGKIDLKNTLVWDRII